jgi:hypothetical protein
MTAHSTIFWHSKHPADAVAAWLMAHEFHLTLNGPGDRMHLIKGDAHFVVREDGALWIVAAKPFDTLHELDRFERYGRPVTP